MPGLLIKDLPPELHRRLKAEAARHHRSMTRQALALLEAGLMSQPRNAADLLPRPSRPALKLTGDDVVDTLRNAREATKAEPEQ